MLRTSDPYHPFNLPVTINQRQKAARTKQPAADHRVRRRIEDILEQRAIDKLFEV